MTREWRKQYSTNECIAKETRRTVVRTCVLFAGSCSGRAAISLSPTNVNLNWRALDKSIMVVEFRASEDGCDGLERSSYSSLGLVDSCTVDRQPIMSLRHRHLRTAVEVNIIFVAAQPCCLKNRCVCGYLGTYVGQELTM